MESFNNLYPACNPSAAIIVHPNSSDSVHEAQALPSNPFPQEIVNSNEEDGASLSQRRSKQENPSELAYIGQLPRIGQLPQELQCHISQYLSMDDVIEALYVLENEIEDLNLSPEKKAELLTARSFLLVSLYSGWVDFDFHRRYIDYFIKKTPRVRFQNLEGIVLKPSNLERFNELRKHFPRFRQVSLRKVQSPLSCTSYDFLEKVTDLGLSKTRSLAGLEHFSHLKTLTIYDSKMHVITFEATMPELLELEIQSNEIERLSGLNHLPQLSKIRLQECESFDDLRFIEACLSLKDVYLEQCAIQNLAGLEAFPSLQKLSLVNCVRFRSLTLPEAEETTFSFENLKELYLNGSVIENLEGLEQFPSLTQLSLIRCSKLESLGGLELCPQLKTLHIDGGWSLTDVSALESCSCLTQLTLSSDHCYDDALVEVLKACQSVQELHLKGFGNEYIIEELEAVLATLPKLPKLVLDDCADFNHLDRLKTRGIQVKIC